MMKDEGARYTTIVLGDEHAVLAIALEVMGRCPDCGAPVRRTPDLCELVHGVGCRLAATVGRAA